jgi:hypothetical protein
MYRLNPGATSHIPSVRGGRADFVWKNGQPLVCGYGGVFVPIPDQRGSGSDDVVPDDSASQAGPAVSTNAYQVSISHKLRTSQQVYSQGPGMAFGDTEKWLA